MEAGLEHESGFMRRALYEQRVDERNAVLLERQLRPVFESVALQIIRLGLEVFSKISGSAFDVAKPVFMEDRCSLDLGDSGSQGISVYPNGTIKLQNHDSGHFFHSENDQVWNVRETVKMHILGPNQMAFKNANEQIVLADEVLTAIGAFAGAQSPSFKEGFKPAMKGIQQGYDALREKAVAINLLGRESRAGSPAVAKLFN